LWLKFLIKFDSGKFDFKFDGFKFYTPRPAPLNFKICHQALDFQILFLGGGRDFTLPAARNCEQNYLLSACSYERSDAKTPTIPTAREMLLHLV
jgi:hypothetical protein